MKIQCVITDDEPIALEIIEGYINLLPELNLVTKCNNAIETLTALRNNHVDVLFTDIQMPEINGMDLIRSLKKAPLLVLTTAYSSFALESYELDVVDYLLKPISLERFLKTIEKVYTILSKDKDLQPSPQFLPTLNYFFIKSDAGMVRIEYQKILYIEGLENYLKIVCDDKAIVSLNTMKSIEQLLPTNMFLRIHRSIIINLDKVDSIKGSTFKIKNISLHSGKSYRKSIQLALKTSTFL